jgi:glycerol uptake facilitator-like aquaporin
MDKNLMRAYLAELIGTFALVFFGAGAVCVNYMLPDAGLNTPVGWPAVIAVALTQGLVLAVALSVTLHFSTGYLNPAVTLMLWCFNRLDTPKMIWYVGAQLVGGALAGLCLYATFDLEVRTQSHLGTPHVNLRALGARDPSSVLDVVAPGTGIELVLTFFLVFAIFGTMLMTRGERATGLTVGLAMVAITLVGYWFTGAAANPARWFGTVVWERLDEQPAGSAFANRSPFFDMFVFVGGPILGALLAGAVFFKYLLPENKQKDVFPKPDVTDGKAAPAPTAVKAKK